MRWRTVAAVAGIAVVAGGVSAFGWGLFAYTDATKIDRSNPKVVTDEFLRATLVRKDEAGADLYACEDQKDLAAIKALREELDRREKEFGVSILVSWGAYRGDPPDLTAELLLTAQKDGRTQAGQSESWRFRLIDEDGWRVCGAQKIDAA